MKCPHCEKEINIGSLLGSRKSEKKTNAARLNGMKGGHPKKGAISHVKPKGLDLVEIVYPEGSVIVNGVLQTPMKDEVKNMVNLHKCQSPYCPSTKTHEYSRSTGWFWLCDTHKP